MNVTSRAARVVEQAASGGGSGRRPASGAAVQPRCLPIQCGTTRCSGAPVATAGAYARSRVASTLLSDCSGLAQLTLRSMRPTNRSAGGRRLGAARRGGGCLQLEGAKQRRLRREIGSGDDPRKTQRRRDGRNPSVLSAATPHPPLPTLLCHLWWRGPPSSKNAACKTMHDTTWTTQGDKQTAHGQAARRSSAARCRPAHPKFADCKVEIPVLPSLHNLVCARPRFLCSFCHECTAVTRLHNDGHATAARSHARNASTHAYAATNSLLHCTQR